MGSDGWEARSTDAEVVTTTSHPTGVELGHQWQRILSTRPGRITELCNRETVGVLRKQLCSHKCCGIDRVAMESDAVALHHMTAPHQLAQIIAIHVVE